MDSSENLRRDTVDFFRTRQLLRVVSNAGMASALKGARQVKSAIEHMRAKNGGREADRAAQQLVGIVESSHDAIVSKNLDGVIMTWNRGAERLFGYTAEEAIGRPVTILIPPDRLDEEPDILARIRRGDLVDHFETVRQRKDETYVDISLTISPVRDEHGNVVGASKIARDISERKRVEARLKESESRWKELLSAIPAAIYATDAEGKVTYYNDKVVDLTGRRPSPGSNEWCLTWKMYKPDGTPLSYEQSSMAVVIKEGRSIRSETEAISERPDGCRIPFMPLSTPIRDADGTIVGAIHVLVDVSDRKNAETQQRILFDELNHRVKNNMQMLQSLLNLSKKKTRSVEARQVLTEAASRIASMTAAQQVLYKTVDASRFKAHEFLDAVCDAVRYSLSSAITIVRDADDVELSNDAAMPLALIINELLTNAAKHGGARSGNTTVRIGLKREGESFVLYVEDNGPGFDWSEVRPRSSGLYLVEGLVRQLRGRFDVASGASTRCIVQFS